jgi:glyoxylase-like metal-dependent hydrolase (beta-lactamase superfamily II)
MRAVSLHPDVIVVTSALLRVNCVIVRGAVAVAADVPKRLAEQAAAGVEPGIAEELAAETFVIDSPVLPDELDALAGLLEQARFPAPSGLLATHGDWDHLLGRLAFPGVALGCAQSTAARLQAAPGEAQRELRAFDEELMIERPRPLSLGAVQALPVPGRCDIGERELQLHRAEGHTRDGMAVLIPWAGVLVVGDYLSELEIPTLGDADALVDYPATLERLRALIAGAEHVVPGHGPVLDRQRALAVLEEDLGYVRALAERGAKAEPPARARAGSQRAAHARNVASIAARERLDSAAHPE